MTISCRHLVLSALAIVLAACAPDADERIVATAGTHTLTVADAADMIVAASNVQANPTVVAAMTELWIDYTLLAEALQADSMLLQLDFDRAIRAQLEQDAIMALRGAVIAPDTVVPDEEMRAIFDAQTLPVRVRARHILLRYPDQATAAQRDSVRQVAQATLETVRAGADFATLAAEVSQDAATAPNGGDLGYVNQGALVAPLDSAAFALQPGETSGLVESAFGLHIVRSEEKGVPTFDDVREPLRRQLVARRYQQAESLYIAGLESEAGLEIRPGAVDLMRRVAREPSAADEMGESVLVSYDGGEVRVSELEDFFATRPSSYREQLAEADDQAVRGQVAGLGQRELLLAEAVQQGFEVAEPNRDSLATEIRRSLREAGDSIGVTRIEVGASETPHQAVGRVVRDRVRQMVADERNVVTLGPVALVLRQTAEVTVEPAQYAWVVEEVRLRQPALAAAGDPTGSPPNQP